MATQIVPDALERSDALSFMLQAQAVLKAACNQAEDKADEYRGLQVLIEGVYRDIYESTESGDEEKLEKSSSSVNGACSLLDAYIGCDAADERLNAVQTLLDLAKWRVGQEWEALKTEQLQSA